MTTKQNTLLQDYAEKKEQAAILAEEIKSLEPKVLGLLEKQGLDTLKETYGTFSRIYRKTWTYTKELLQKEDEYAVIIKARKDEEQKNGEAKAEEKVGLSYRKYEPKTEN